MSHPSYILNLNTPMVSSSTNTTTTDSTTAAAAAVATSRVNRNTTNSHRDENPLILTHPEHPLDDMEESILDFSEMESFSDFLQGHHVYSLRGTAAVAGGDRDRGYSCSDDDLLTNSDQWSSISNLNSVSNLNSNTNHMNHTNTTNNTTTHSSSLSNLRSILEPTPEESGREDSTSRTLSPLQSPHLLVASSLTFNHPPNTTTQPHSHSMNIPSSLLLEQFHTLQQPPPQNIEDHTNSSSNNNSFSFLDHRDNTLFPLPVSMTPTAAAVTNSHPPHTSNSYDGVTTAPLSNNCHHPMMDHMNRNASSSNHDNYHHHPNMASTSSHHAQPQQEQPPSLNSNSSGMNLTNPAVTASTADTIPGAIATLVYTASTIPVQEPNINDVLLGRGGKNNQWSGNETLREMARTMSNVYSAAPKRNKPAIAMVLVQKMRALTPSGRYVGSCG